MTREKQEIIDNLIFHLKEKPIPLKSGNVIEFKKSNQNSNNEGTFIIDSLKTGIYKIHFPDRLSLSLISNGSFKFTNLDINPVNTVSIEGIDTRAILDIINLLTIE